MIYNLRYSQWGEGYLILGYSIINKALEINSVMFGFPENNLNSDSLIQDIYQELLKR